MTLRLRLADGSSVGILPCGFGHGGFIGFRFGCAVMSSRCWFGPTGRLAQLAHRHNRSYKALRFMRLIPNVIGPFYRRGNGLFYIDERSEEAKYYVRRQP